MRRSIAALTVVVLSTVLLAACGDSGSSTTETKTVTVPAGKLGSSTLIHEGRYMGSTKNENPTRSISFTYSIENGITNFKLGDVTIAMPMNATGAGFTKKIGKVTITGAWVSDTRVTGTIDTVTATSSSGQSLVKQAQFEANAFAS